MTNHIVFVYGTLRRGEGNSHLLSNSKCLGPATTAGFGYKMSRSGTVPFVSDGGNYQVQGEVWIVGDTTFTRLDRLESHPRFYCRRRRWFWINLPNKRTLRIRGWIYICDHPWGTEIKAVAGKLRCPTRLELAAGGNLD